MGIKPCTDASAAGWISTSDVPWDQLVGFGPAGFASHARLRFIPDPTHEGQAESEFGAGPGAVSETEQLATAVDALLHHTSTPDELFFAFWDGFGFAMPAAHFEVPNRGFFLYRGSVSDNGSWDIPVADRAPGQQWMPVPAFIWPADHAWCIARDVDPHWAGIGAGPDALVELLREETVDVVPANTAEPQPTYY